MKPAPAVLGIVAAGACATARAGVAPLVGGSVAPGFEDVRATFESNFAQRNELGAALAVYHQGVKVVDVWGGFLDKDRQRPWLEDSMVVVFSTTKGLAAVTLAMAHSKGWLDYDAPVATYWPEFAQHGKQHITVRQLLAHEAGLVTLKDGLDVSAVMDLDAVASQLAREAPQWTPGQRHGYHASTIGLYINELMRRVDPSHRTIGQVFAQDVAAVLGAEFYIGLPTEIPDARLATIQMISPMGGLTNLGKVPLVMWPKLFNPWSTFNASLAIPTGYNANQRASLAVELAAGNGVGTARGVAAVYNQLATGAPTLGISQATLEQLYAAPPQAGGAQDAVMGIETYFSLGFWKPSPDVEFGSSRRAVASAGAGGSFAYADPDALVAYAYVMNRMDYYVKDDPREGALRASVKRCVQQLQNR